MRRAILRFLGLVSLAAGLVSAVIDLVATPAQQGAADPVAARNRRFRLSCGAVSCIGVTVAAQETRA